MTLKLTGAALIAAVSLAAAIGVAKAQDAPAAGAAAAGDPTAGARVFIKCRACHQIGPDAKNAVGPNLNGVIGRKAGTVADYNYSDANKSSGLTWDEATFKKYIADPKAVVPGTKMTFAGDSNEKDLDNLFAYVSQYQADGTMKK